MTEREKRIKEARDIHLKYVDGILKNKTYTKTEIEKKRDYFLSLPVTNDLQIAWRGQIERIFDRAKSFKKETDRCLAFLKYIYECDYNPS